jgi:hypothetical protein
MVNLIYSDFTYSRQNIDIRNKERKRRKRRGRKRKAVPPSYRPMQ